MATDLEESTDVVESVEQGIPPRPKQNGPGRPSKTLKEAQQQWDEQYGTIGPIQPVNKRKKKETYIQSSSEVQPPSDELIQQIINALTREFNEPEVVAKLDVRIYQDDKKISGFVEKTARAVLFNMNLGFYKKHEKNSLGDVWHINNPFNIKSRVSDGHVMKGNGNIVSMAKSIYQLAGNGMTYYYNIFIRYNYLLKVVDVHVIDIFSYLASDILSWDGGHGQWMVTDAKLYDMLDNNIIPSPLNKLDRMELIRQKCWEGDKAHIELRQQQQIEKNTFMTQLINDELAKQLINA